MTARPASSPPPGEKAALWALMMGNVAIGSGVIAPSGMMNALATDLGVEPSAIGRLIAYGAVLLCIGAPLSAWLTNRIGRRALLTGALLVYAVGHAASVFAPNYDALLAIRLLMIGAAAIYTPQAASAVQSLVAPDLRAASIGFVFLGWSVASAAAIPLASVGSAYLGWRAVFAGFTILMALAAFGVWRTLPAGLYAPRLSGAAWGRVFRHGGIFAIVSVTAIQMVGVFALFPYLPADLKRTANASPEAIAAILATYGVMGIVGNAIAVRAVGRIGAAGCVAASIAAIAAGLAIWPFLSGDVATVFICAVTMGLGFSAGNSMQQARLGALAPELTSASMSLNTSAIYVGQAIGAAIGAALWDRGAADYMPVAGVVSCLVALFVSAYAYKRYRA